MVYVCLYAIVQYGLAHTVTNGRNVLEIALRAMHIRPKMESVFVISLRQTSSVALRRDW